MTEYRSGVLRVKTAEKAIADLRSYLDSSETDADLLSIIAQAEHEGRTELDLSGNDLENYDRLSKKSCKILENRHQRT